MEIEKLKHWSENREIKVKECMRDSYNGKPESSKKGQPEQRGKYEKGKISDPSRWGDGADGERDDVGEKKP